MKTSFLILSLMFAMTAHASDSSFVLDCKGHSTTKDFKDFRIVVEKYMGGHKATLSYGFAYQSSATIVESWFVNFQDSAKTINVDGNDRNEFKLNVVKNDSAWVDDIQGMEGILSLSHTTYRWPGAPLTIAIKNAAVACRTEYPIN